MTAADFFARSRVRLGYLVGALVLVLAHPTPRSIALGCLIGLLGLLIRGYGAGYLHKQEVLTTTGPYAYSRNPLYFGSSILALAAAVATNSLLAAILLVVYFALVYSFVIRREEAELRVKHTAAFDDYIQRVPRFFPRLTPAKSAETSSGFSWAQYRKNHEYEAAIGFLLLLFVLLVIWRIRLH